MSVKVRPTVRPPIPGANFLVVVNSTTITSRAVSTTSTTIADPSPKYLPDHRLAANWPRFQSSRPEAMP